MNTDDHDHDKSKAIFWTMKKICIDSKKWKSCPQEKAVSYTLESTILIKDSTIWVIAAINSKVLLLLFYSNTIAPVNRNTQLTQISISSIKVYLNYGKISEYFK